MEATLRIDDSTMSESMVFYSETFRDWRLKASVKDGALWLQASSLHLLLGMLDHQRETVLLAIKVKADSAPVDGDLYSAPPCQLVAEPPESYDKQFTDALSLGKQAREKAWEANKAAPSSQGD